MSDQPQTERRFTAEEFEDLASFYERGPDAAVVPRPSAMLSAALRMAAAVETPDILEIACAKLAGIDPDQIHPEEWGPEASIIREAIRKGAQP